jgi:hypothetical protein
MWPSKSLQENGNRNHKKQGIKTLAIFSIFILTNQIIIIIVHFLCLVTLFFTIYMMQKVTMWKKFYVIYSFFFVRKIIAHVVTFTFYCVILPATVLVPEVEVPKWGAVYIPCIITLLNAVGTPR